MPTAPAKPIISQPASAFPIVSTNDLARQRLSTVLYKGAPLTGKTYNVGTWTAAGPLLYILWDPKSETISQFPDVFIIAPKDPAQFTDVILPRIIAGTLVDAQGSKLDYATVAIDSLSFFAREVELGLMGKADEMPMGGWNVFSNKIARVLGALGALARSPSVPHPANFLVTIHEQERTKQVKDSQGRREFVSDGMLPKISGGIRTILEGYFDLTLLTTKRTELLAPEPGQSVRRVRTVYECRTVGQEKAQAAGGGFGGIKSLPPIVDGTYPGLCKLAGIDPRTRQPISDAAPPPGESPAVENGNDNDNNDASASASENASESAST